MYINNTELEIKNQYYTFLGKKTTTKCHKVYMIIIIANNSNVKIARCSHKEYGLKRGNGDFWEHVLMVFFKNMYTFPITNTCYF